MLQAHAARQLGVSVSFLAKHGVTTRPDVHEHHKREWARQLRKTWDRESIIAAVQRWEATYGAPPCAIDWNAPLARSRGHKKRARRFLSGDWPRYGTTQQYFPSWNTMIEAAGFIPRPVGASRPPSLHPRQPSIAPYGPGSRPPVPQHVIDVAQILVDSGMTKSDAALVMGVSNATISRRVR